MRNVTGAEVKAAMMEKNISVVKHHDCCICGVWVEYKRHEERLFFDSSCGCLGSDPEPREWDDAADWINMQSNPDNKKEIAARFGIEL